MKNTELVVVAASCSGGQCPTIYKIADDTCNNGACPTVYGDTDRPDVLIVQGYNFTLDCPDGEQAVEIPTSLIETYLKNREGGSGGN